MGKLERRLKNLLALRTFTYDFCEMIPWISMYLSVCCAKASTYYIKTFASSAFYGNISRTKHEKNKILLKIAAVSTLMFGLFVGIGNESYEEKKRAQQILNKEELKETAGGFDDDQIEGSNCVSRQNEKINVIESRVINGTYQRESELMLSSRYLNQRAHDVFEYMTEICVSLEDKFLHSFIIPSYLMH